MSAEYKYSALGVTLKTNAPAFGLFVVLFVVAYTIFASFWGFVIWAVTELFADPHYWYCWVWGLILSLVIGAFAGRNEA